MFPFFVLALMLAFALQQLNAKYSSGITQAQGRYLACFAKENTDPHYLAPKQFFKLANGSGEFACAFVCIEFSLITASLHARQNNFCEYPLGISLRRLTVWSCVQMKVFDHIIRKEITLKVLLFCFL